MHVVKDYLRKNFDFARMVHGTIERHVDFALRFIDDRYPHLVLCLSGRVGQSLEVPLAPIEAYQRCSVRRLFRTVMELTASL